MKRRILILAIFLALLISIAVLSIRKFYGDDLSVNGKYYYFFNLDMGRIFELCKDAKGKNSVVG